MCRNMKTVLECVILAVISVNFGDASICPEGYCRHSGGCYLVVELKTSWIDARQYCSVLGGSLLGITSLSQQTAVEGALRRSKGLIEPGTFWLDITDLLNPNDWRTMQSRTSLSYSNWRGTVIFTNDTTSRNCVYMSESIDYKWRPAPCDRKMNFVCYRSGTRDYRYQYYDGIEC